MGNLYDVFRQSDGVVIESGFSSKEGAQEWARKNLWYLPQGYWYID